MLSRYSGQFWKTTTGTFFKMYWKTCWHLTSVIFSVDQRNECFLDISLFFCCPSSISQICPEAQDAEQAEQSATHAMDWLESCFRYFILNISSGQVLTYGQKLNLVIFSHIFIFLKDSIPCNKTRSPWHIPPNTNTCFSLNKALYFIIWWWKGHQIDPQISSLTQTKKREHLI